MTIAFDCDGTLINLDGSPRHEVIQLFLQFERLGCELYIWSGGGKDYARDIARKLGLKASIVAKNSFTPDLAVDDQAVEMGKANLQVPTGE